MKTKSVLGRELLSRPVRMSSYQLGENRLTMHEEKSLSTLSRKGLVLPVTIPELRAVSIGPVSSTEATGLLISQLS